MRIESIVADIMTVVLVGGIILAFPGFSLKQTEAANKIKTIKLPPPMVKGKFPLRRQSRKEDQKGIFRIEP